MALRARPAGLVPTIVTDALRLYLEEGDGVGANYGRFRQTHRNRIERGGAARHPRRRRIIINEQPLFFARNSSVSLSSQNPTIDDDGHARWELRGVVGRRRAVFRRAKRRRPLRRLSRPCTTPNTQGATCNVQRITTTCNVKRASWSSATYNPISVEKSACARDPVIRPLVSYIGRCAASVDAGNVERRMAEAEERIRQTQGTGRTGRGGLSSLENTRSAAGLNVNDRDE